ncbi:MAG: WbqC family protein [Bacteroidetes bacterium]|nr:WbqC family protein [Bacteroidota bacterium]
MNILTSYIPFPNISWWQSIKDASNINFDAAEHFEKMTYRNKYFISGANGGIQLSIPLQKGREQRTPMADVRIDNKQRWQIQHWRTLVSVYKRTPYFEHYEYTLQSLFEKNYEYLIDFNSDSIQWLKKQLKLSFDDGRVDVYQKEVEGRDLRTMKPGSERNSIEQSPYYQIFSDKNGFLPNLSIIDLLFSEGPNAMQWITKNAELINDWRDQNKKG